MNMFRSLARMRPIRRHPESWRSLDEIGPPQPYKKSFPFIGPFASAYQYRIAAAPGGRMDQPFWIDLGVDGYLLHSEAMKLYELAYFSDGDVLELGTYKGLSTSIIARALNDSGRPNRLHTCGIDLNFSSAAKQFIQNRRGGDRVTFHVKDATEFLDELIRDGKTFGMAFIDHWHGYEATYAAASRLASLLKDGGFAMFHNYDVSQL